MAQGRDPKKALEGILAPYLDEFGGGNAGNARMDAYRRLAGEAEARAVQSRMDMTPEQRRATFPFDSYDVPRDKLILRDLLKGPAEATVWHGSPHQFDAFDSSKIGTGEGAQAYGHGLYLAEAKDVADI